MRQSAPTRCWGWCRHSATSEHHQMWYWDRLSTASGPGGRPALRQWNSSFQHLQKHAKLSIQTWYIIVSFTKSWSFCFQFWLAGCTRWTQIHHQACFDTRTIQNDGTSIWNSHLQLCGSSQSQRWARTAPWRFGLLALSALSWGAAGFYIQLHTWKLKIFIKAGILAFNMEIHLPPQLHFLQFLQIR